MAYYSRRTRLEAGVAYLFCLMVGVCGQVNVALRKPVINAYLTCGSDGLEQYYDHAQIIVEPMRRRKDNCTSPDDHPPSYMNDGLPTTFWQSTSRAILARYGHVTPNPEVEINLDLEKLYPVKRIQIQMGKSKRPGMIAIKKSVNPQQPADLPWVYRVSTERECRTAFGVPPTSVPSRLDGAICEVYTTTEGFADYGSLITFDFTSITGDMITWTEARSLKFQFYNMDITYGWAGIMFQHYAVSEIYVMAECQCNGLQIDCVISNTTGQYECVCGGNTQGESCQECQPFYRQQPFQPGKPCEQCNCHNHADICEYNQTVANNSWSLNAEGEHVGGGVCINCRDHTAGINCEKCENFYYRPAGVAQTSATPCVLCTCSLAGVKFNPLTGLVGDCVMNDDIEPPSPGMVPGDCFCKENVQGSKCDSCKTGFFNLTETNPLGCQECACDPAGSISSAAVCSPNATGQCPCKLYVTGRQCDQCMDTYYGLDANNTEGCSSCQCDIGGATDDTCDPENGQCQCQRNVEGRQCVQPVKDFYYPDPHFIHGEFENLDQPWGRDLTDYRYFGYAKATAGISVMANVTIPIGTLFDNQYMLILRYNGNMMEILATVRLTQPPYPIAKATLSDIGLLPCTGTEWCYYVSTKLSLTPGQYLVTVTTRGDILLDRVIIMPSNLVDNTAFLGDQDAQKFKLQCDILKTDQMDATTDTGRFCLSKIFSMTMHYLAGALPCSCHYLGSYSNTTCDPVGGQCVCKPGVFTRTCSECQLEFYDLTSTGCKPCECAGDDKVCDRVTGQCNCPPLTTGRQCDQCELNNWNWTATDGCQPCGCNVTGSSNLQCNLTSGVCECKQGVTGEKCDRCMDGFMGFSATGCTSCQCDPAGTLSTGVVIGCDALTGQCPCKANSEGSRCEKCKTGTFYNHISHPDGCLECVCMGVAEECQSTIYYLKTHRVDVISKANPAMSTLYLATEGGVVNAAVNVTTVDGMLMANVAIGANANTYWQHPTELKGNLLGLYGSNVSFTVYYTVSAPTLQPIGPSLVIYGYNNMAYRFPVSAIPIANVTKVDVTITERHASGVNITRQELLLALVDVKKVLIPAAWYPTEHQSYIGEISYRMADTLGTEDRALAVEQCVCPAGYKGLSCEECASGYHRDNMTDQGYLGYCVKCECNGHSDICDPDTGECLDCQHNTEGFNCDQCKDGYHGDATKGTESDCIPCPCYQPRVANASCELNENGMPRCLYCAEGYTGDLCNKCEQFYYGNPLIQTFGTCKRCECNNNTDVCDPVTGICKNCGFNTTGDQCERCMDGFYGDATTQNCTECQCDPVGSVSQICDSESGNCTCHPGLGSRTCSTCLENYYSYTNLTFTGCIPCNCNEFGSVSLQCPETGVCSCLDTVAAGYDKCDMCKEGYWGLPDQVCQACACNPTGTVDPGTGVLLCDRHTGQCECKPGVAGRQCDTCDHLFVNFGPNGCSKCGRCQDALGNDTLVLLDLAEDFLNKTQKVVDVQTLDPKLQNLTDQVNETRASLGLSEDRLDLLTETSRNLTLMEIKYKTALQQLTTKVNSAMLLAETLKNATQADLDRLTTLENQSQSALDTAISIQTLTPQVIARLQFYNTSAYDLFALGNSIYVSMNTTFDTELRKVQEELSLVRSTLADATSMQLKTYQQSNLTSSLRNSASLSDAQLKILKTKVSSAIEKLMGISYQVTQLYKDFNATVENRDKALSLLNETQNILAAAEDVLVTSAGDFVTAQQWLKDCLVIYNGVTVGPLPVQTSVDLTGIRGWVPDSKRLEQELNKTEDQLSEYQGSVAITESTAARLTQEAQNIQDRFQAVKDKGQDAVNAIDNYQEVVNSLNESLQMALQANKTMSETISLLKAVSVDDLNAQAMMALNQSQHVLESVNKWNNTPDLLRPQIAAANDSLNRVLDDWNLLNFSLTNLQTNADALQDKINTSNIAEKIQEASALAERVLDTANNVILIDNNVRPLVDLEEKQVTQIHGMVTNASLVEGQIRKDLNNFRDQLTNGIQRTIDLTNVEFSKTNQSRYLLEEKLTQLEAKLSTARQKLAALEQPVNFDYESFETLTNEDKGKPLIFTEITLQFAYRYVPKGVLYFSENDETQEKILLQLDNEAIMFEIKNIDSMMSVQSPAVLCPNCWFRVIATRYGLDGQLTVTKIDTGGTAVSTMRLDSTEHELLTTTSDVYVAGLPRDYPDKVNKTSTDPQFEGCIYNMVYNGEQLPLWQRTLSIDSTSRCCPRPPPLPTPPTINAVDFKGFGYIQINRAEFKVEQQGQVSLQFRTFDANAVLLLVDHQFSTAYYGLFLSDGYVLFDIVSDNDTVTSNKRTTVRSLRRYNDGEWYKVSALHNSTYAQISVQKRVMMPEDTVDTRSSINIIKLMSLNEAQMTVGGQNPNTTLNHGPISSGFAGAVVDFQLSQGVNQIPMPWPLTRAATLSHNVNLYEAYEEVVPGLGLSDPDGYVTLQAVPSIISNLEFNLLTYEPIGVILFAQLRANPPQTYFYIGLFNGDILVMFDQGLGTKVPVRTRGQYLATGQPHSIKVDFGATNTPRLTVDGNTQVGQVTMSPGMPIEGSTIYFGGIPPTISLPLNDVPTRKPLIGGIQNLKINTQPVDFFNEVTVNQLHQQGAYLSGLPAPPKELPPVPYTTTPAPPTTPSPTCATPVQFSPAEDNIGLRFGDFPVSYMALNVTQWQLFEHAFLIKVQFRAVAGDGNLVYFASSTSSNPNNYFAVYLKDGYVYASMKAESTATTPGQTLKLRSTKDAYDDGNWWQVEVLRIEDFMAIIVNENKDYANNGVPTMSKSTLRIRSPLYAGGVPTTMTGLPFTADAGVPIGTVPFKGCIRKIEVTTRTQELLKLYPSMPLETSKNLQTCYASVSSGIYLQTPTSYLTLTDGTRTSFDFTSGFSIEVNFTSSYRNGTLVSMWQISPKKYFLLGFYNGKVKVVLGNSVNPNKPFVAVTNLGDSQYSLCDRKPHTVKVILESTGLAMEADGRSEGFQFSEQNYQVNYIYGRELYLGLREPTWSAPSELAAVSFQACVKSVKVRGVELKLFRSTSKSAVEEGCPSPPGEDEIMEFL